MNIYIKARTFIEVLKGFVHEAKRQFHDIAHEVNLPFFFDVIQNSEYVDVRKVPYGANEYKAGYVNNREYKDHHMLFMFPKEKEISRISSRNSTCFCLRYFLLRCFFF
jgi:predicted 3-demethylubiquinone-9 3-methyltransferase (glyoxalase superfamily)